MPEQYRCPKYVYLESQRIAATSPSFYGLLAALVRKADTDNLDKIKAAWPGFVEEFMARYNAPGGDLPTD